MYGPTRVVDQGLDQIENRFILSPSDKQCKLPGCPKDSHIVVLQTFAWSAKAKLYQYIMRTTSKLVWPYVHPAQDRMTERHDDYCNRHCLLLESLQLNSSWHAPLGYQNREQSRFYWAWATTCNMGSCCGSSLNELSPDNSHLQVTPCFNGRRS